MKRKKREIYLSVYESLYFRITGDIPEQQHTVRSDPEMSGGLPRIQKSYLPKVMAENLFLLRVHIMQIFIKYTDLQFSTFDSQLLCLMVIRETV